MANDDRGSLLQRHLLLVAALCDPRTSKGDCQVLAVIGGHVDKDGEGWPGVNRIAGKAGIHRATVLRSVERLERWGYVQTHREKGKANLYRIALTSSTSATSTSSASATSAAGAPVASTHRASSTSATGPVAPTLPDQSHQCDPNSAFDLSSSTQEKNSVACGAFSADQEQEREEQRQKQQRLAEEERKAERQASIRQEYLECRATHPDYAKRMERSFPKELADLIERAA